MITIGLLIDISVVVTIKWLLSDLLHLSSRNHDRLSFYTKKNHKRPLVLQTITNALQTKQISWLPTIQSKINSLLAVTPDLLPSNWGPSPVSYAIIWLPKFLTWVISSGYRKKVPVSLVSLDLLRRL